MLPQWLKNIPRAVRSQWHGDFYDELKNMAAQLEKLSEKVTSLQQSSVYLKQFKEKSEVPMNTMAKWQTAALCNQISLANKRPGGRTIYTPWAPKKSFTLIMLKDGHLGFYPEKKLDSIPRGILVNSMPKAGTYYMAAILESLGFVKLAAFGYPTLYHDLIRYSGDVDIPYELKSVDLPFEVQMGLMQPNHYMLAHLGEYESIIAARRHGLEKMLFIVRDLRLTLVSGMRYFYKNSGGFQPLSAYSSEDVYKYLNFNWTFPFFFGVAQCCVNLLRDNYGCMVRYEELVSHDKEKMLPSLQAISEVTGCSVDDIFKAVEAKNGAQTSTQTNDHVTLDRIWTKEVEELFIAKGGDVLNEKLGYPKEYIFNT